MAGHFLILDVGTNKIIEMAIVKPNPVPAGKKCVAMLCCQPDRARQLDDVYEETRTWEECRQARYALELQPVKDALEGQKEDGDETIEIQAEYDALRAEIKAEYPKPV